MSLDGKACIITGGGSGIGRSTALAMARDGAAVALVGRTVAKVETVRDEVRARGGTAVAFGVDVADLDGVTRMTESVKAELGGPHVLVNNAGHSSHHRRVLTTTEEEIRAVIDSNLMGTIFCTQAALPAMLEAGEGTIINVSSRAGIQGSMMGGMAYSAAKAGVINFTRFINNEYPDNRIRASVVIPGEVDTPVLDKRPVPPDKAGRATMAGPDDVADVITLIARLPIRTNVPELIVQPTVLRDLTPETSRFP